MSWDDFERLLCWVVLSAAYDRGVLHMSEHQFTMERWGLMCDFYARWTR